MEKTCCLTSEEGFEFSAPIAVLAELRTACTMMLQLEEVGAHGLAEKIALVADKEMIGRNTVTHIKASRRCACVWNVD